MNKIVGATNMGGVSAMSIRDVVSRCALAIGLFLGGDLSASAAPAITLLPLVGPPRQSSSYRGPALIPRSLSTSISTRRIFAWPRVTRQARLAARSTFRAPRNPKITGSLRLSASTDWRLKRPSQFVPTGPSSTEGTPNIRGTTNSRTPSRRPTFLILIFYGENRLECLERKVRP